MLELSALPLEQMDLVPGGVSHAVAGKPLLPCLHELLGPRVVGVRLDALPPAQVTHGDLAAEALQRYTNLLFRVYLRLVAALTVLTKDLAASVCSSAAVALTVSAWDIFGSSIGSNLPHPGS